MALRAFWPPVKFALTVEEEAALAAEKRLINIRVRCPPLPAPFPFPNRPAC